MKKNKLLSIAVLLLALGITACGGGSKGNETSQESGTSESSTKPQESTEETPDSPIKSLTATVEHVDLKLGEATSVTPYYKLTGYKTLSSKEKKVTITSSNPEAVKITGNIMTGLVADGTSTITITSQADETKSCSFDVLVKDIFFNRTYSEINGSDDLEKELPADGGIVVTSGGTSDMLIFNQELSTSFMASTKIIINSVSDGELWPKFGMVFKQVDEDKELTTDYAIVFLDAPMNRVSNGVANWTDFGYCEINGGVFAWDSNNPAYSRHKEDVFIKKDPIDYNQEFTLTSVVEGNKIHMFLGYGEGENAKEVYMFTLDAMNDIFGGRGFIPGLFNFNSVVTFKDYTYTTDAAAISAKMNGVTERLADYDNGDYEGTKYYEE